MRLLLTLLLLLEAIESSKNIKKVNEVLKNVGKRYHVWEMTYEAKRDLLLLAKHRNWTLKTETQVDKIKIQNAKNLVNHFLEVSSSENQYFNESLKWINSIMSPEMSAQLCGGKALNSYQYTKYLSTTGSNFQKTSDKTYPLYEIVKTPRDKLQVNMQFTQIDSFGLNVYIHYDISLNLTFVKARNDSVFSITHINQGGTCMDHGVYRYSTLKEDSDLIDHLNSHPNSLNIINLFTPRIFLSSEAADPKKIPDSWLNGLDPNGAFIEICHDGETDPVRYTNDQLRSWYKRFRMMWNPVSEDYIKTQIQHVNRDTVVARITMTLRMGKNENIIAGNATDWDFKISIAKNLRGDQKWYINKFKMNCAPTVDYKDQSLRVIRDVVIQEFLESVENIPRPIPWYSSVEFVKKFTKTGTVEVEFCDARNVTNMTALKLTLFHEGNLKNVDLRYYKIDYDDIPLPATELTYFRVSTISKCIVSKPRCYFLEHEWMFVIKWDRMDQFYYIHKLQIGCALHQGLSSRTRIDAIPRGKYEKCGFYYKIDYDDIPLPATDLTYFVIHTISRFVVSQVKFHVFDHEWIFVIKWMSSSQNFADSHLESTCTKIVKDFGFNELSSIALRKLAAILKMQMMDMGEETRILMEIAGRTQPCFLDAQAMLKSKKIGISGIMDFAKKTKMKKAEVQELPIFPVPMENVLESVPQEVENAPIQILGPIPEVSSTVTQPTVIQTPTTSKPNRMKYSTPTLDTSPIPNFEEISFEDLGFSEFSDYDSEDDVDSEVQNIQDIETPEAHISKDSRAGSEDSGFRSYSSSDEDLEEVSEVVKDSEDVKKILKDSEDARKIRKDSEDVEKILLEDSEEVKEILRDSEDVKKGLKDSEDVKRIAKDSEDVEKVLEDSEVIKKSVEDSENANLENHEIQEKNDVTDSEFEFDTSEFQNPEGSGFAKTSEDVIVDLENPEDVRFKNSGVQKDLEYVRKIAEDSKDVQKIMENSEDVLKVLEDSEDVKKASEDSEDVVLVEPEVLRNSGAPVDDRALESIEILEDSNFEQLDTQKLAETEEDMTLESKDSKSKDSEIQKTSDAPVEKFEDQEFHVKKVTNVFCFDDGKVRFETVWSGGFKNTWELLENFYGGLQNPAIWKFLKNKKNNKLYEKEKKKSTEFQKKGAKNEEFEVQKICGIKKCDKTGNIIFDVKWYGYSKNTWEPISSFGALGMEHPSIGEFMKIEENRKRYVELVMESQEAPLPSMEQKQEPTPKSTQKMFKIKIKFGQETLPEPAEQKQVLVDTTKLSTPSVIVNGAPLKLRIKTLPERKRAGDLEQGSEAKKTKIIEI